MVQQIRHYNEHNVIASLLVLVVSDGSSQMRLPTAIATGKHKPSMRLFGETTTNLYCFA